MNVRQNYQAPFFEMDPDTYKIALNIDARFVSSMNTTAGDSFGHTFTGEIFLTRLYELVYGLPSTRKDRTGYLNDLVDWVPVNSRTGKDLSNNNRTYSQALQEMSRIAMWNPARGCSPYSRQTPALQHPIA